MFAFLLILYSTSLYQAFSSTEPNPQPGCLAIFSRLQGHWDTTTKVKSHATFDHLSGRNRFKGRRRREDLRVRQAGATAGRRREVSCSYGTNTATGRRGWANARVRGTCGLFFGETKRKGKLERRFFLGGKFPAAAIFFVSPPASNVTFKARKKHRTLTTWRFGL